MEHVRVTIALLAVTMLLTSCGQKTFADADPSGFKACQALVQVRRTSPVSGKQARISSVESAVKLAASASSKDVVAAQRNMLNLAKACQAHGMTIPAQAA
jgi:hypothetical protein